VLRVVGSQGGLDDEGRPLRDDGFDVSAFKPERLREADVLAADRVVAIGVDLGDIGAKARGGVVRWDDIPPFSTRHPKANVSRQGITRDLEALKDAGFGGGRQVFSNLIGNALKFTLSGGRVSVRGWRATLGPHPPAHAPDDPAGGQRLQRRRSCRSRRTVPSPTTWIGPTMNQYAN